MSSLRKLVVMSAVIFSSLHGVNGRAARPSESERVDAPVHVNIRDKLISLNFQDIPVRNVLQVLAEYSGFNIVVSDTVTGSLSLRLEQVAWSKALDIVLQMKGLSKRIDGNIILVTTDKDLASREQQKKLASLSTELIKLKFASAEDVAKSIRGDSQFSLLSERGSVRAEAQLNAVLLKDTRQHLDEISNLVAMMDVAMQQIQIEARIVAINEGNVDELGVQWGYTSHRAGHYANDTSANQLDNSNVSSWSDSSTIDQLFNVSLPATGTGAATAAFQVAMLGANNLLDLELSALQRESKAEIISSPRLLTTDRTPAYIEQGTEIPYLESSSSGATSVAFKKAVLSLKVTPHITPDHQVLLDIDVTQDHPGDVVKTGTGEAVAVNTQKIGTQVLVHDGATVVLGGIYQHSMNQTEDKVPVLGDLPLLGRLFRRSYEQSAKSELLIFVTPTVLNEGKSNLTTK